MTILTAAALGMLLAADSDPEYPLGSLRFPSLTKPAEPVKLTEFSYAFSENGATVQRFEARIRLKAFAFLSGEVFNQRRGIAFTTQRIDLGLTEARGRYVIEGGYRAAKWLVRARAERRPTPASSSDPGWILVTRGALRFNPDFELLLEFLEDTGSEPFLETRPLRRGALGFLYQRGTGVDISANVSASRVRTEAGIETDRRGVNLGAIVYHDHMQVDSAFAYSRSTGRLAASEGFASVALSGELGPYFLGRASTAQRWQPGIKRFENDTRLGITFFGRRHRFFRGGKVGPQVLALTRRAFELGYNERRVYSIDGLLRLRERLALSAMREELANDLDDLYRAEVADRNVPQARFEIARRTNEIDGVRSWIYRVFVGVPWRVNWPFVRSEESVNFVGVEYTQEEFAFLPDLQSVAHEIQAVVALNREMDASFRWTLPARSPTEIVLFIPRRSRFELEFAYAFGR